MCGRFTLTQDQEALSVAYGVDLLLTRHAPRFNIAPSQPVAVLVHRKGSRRIEDFRWGLVPSWAKDPVVGNRMINARAETVARKPAFRGAWARRSRCLVLADGFYEWQKPPGGTEGKRPHWIHRTDGRPFGFAGLWEQWGSPDDPLLTCTILTTQANALVMPVQDRMPVLLRDAREWDEWIDPAVPPGELAGLLRPYPPEGLSIRPVSTFVNSPTNEGPECVRALA